jgi:hypothetical protein
MNPQVPGRALLVAALLLPLLAIRPASAGCPDADGDDVCDAVDECNGGVPMTGAKLRVRKILEPAGSQHVKMKASMNVATIPAIDPLTKGLRIVARDAGGLVLIDVTVPPGEWSPVDRRGWRRIGGGETWGYSDREGTVDGIKQVLVRHRGGGSLKVSIFGQDGPFAPPVELPVTVTLVVDSPMATTGQCGVVTFDGTPGCFYLNQGNKLVCR